MNQQRVQNIPPSIGCPTCQFILTVLDDFCPICGSTFTPRQLWDIYEAATAPTDE